MKIISPYMKISQNERISIEPQYMNSGIKNSMEQALKKKVEKRCNKNGYIDKVDKIIDYSYGVMPAENFNGNAIYDIVYTCRICIPLENTIIISQIKIVKQELIISIHGPIITFIQRENIDTNIFSINENYINKETNRKLNVEDYVKIEIIDKRINQNDTQIKTIGKLIDFASPEEIEEYFNSR